MKEISKYLGQGYEGAANMSGIYSGVQARIAEQDSPALYVHCAAHNLNLGLNDSVEKVQEMRLLYNFFAHSKKGWALHSDLISPESRDITLKHLCQTRWSCYDVVVAFKHRYGAVFKAIDKVPLLSNKKTARDEADGKKKKVAVTKLLQEKRLDLLKAFALFHNAIRTLNEYR